MSAAAIDDPAQPAPLISVVVPALNEAENLPALVGEIAGALGALIPFEIIVVDDGSEDETQKVLAALAATHPVRTIRHRRRAGQSGAMRNGVRGARADWVVTLDGDGQNDPADIPALIAARDKAGGGALMIVGNRVNRKDTWARRKASRAAFVIRNALLRDNLPDSGCSLKLFRRADFLDLPAFDHMHRFLGALMLARGVMVVSIPVNHRPRRAGVSKYTNFGRMLVGISDLFGVMWLIRRTIRSEIEDRPR